MTNQDPRWLTFRWAIVNFSNKAHLWLGQAAACGKQFKTELSEPDTDTPECSLCAAYLQGWLDRQDYGPNPKITEPCPVGARTKVEASA